MIAQQDDLFGWGKAPSNASRSRPRRQGPLPEARHDGMAAAVEAAPDEWKAQACRLIEALIARGEPFSAADLFAAGLPRLAENRALGGIFSGYARERRIEPTGRAVVNPVSANGTSIREWRPVRQ